MDATTRSRGSRAITRPARSSRRRSSRRCAAPTSSASAPRPCSRSSTRRSRSASTARIPTRSISSREVQRLQKQYTPFTLRAGHAVPRVVRSPRRLLGDVLHVPMVARDREGPPDAVRGEGPDGQGRDVRVSRQGPRAWRSVAMPRSSFATSSAANTTLQRTSDISSPDRYKAIQLIRCAKRADFRIVGLKEERHQMKKLTLAFIVAMAFVSLGRLQEEGRTAAPARRWPR